MSKKEQLQNMLTPDNWEELQFRVNAAAHNEDGPDIAITDQFWEDAINEIISENLCAHKIMRADHLKIKELEAYIAQIPST